mmetsp:Transcript_164934/g.529406  ORF Transcript_164934/g.529406 Transcript_164934/m.529406 type:complete len:424 (+) Transcript_164934:1205-2476(+)
MRNTPSVVQAASATSASRPGTSIPERSFVGAPWCILVTHPQGLAASVSRARRVQPARVRAPTEGAPSLRLLAAGDATIVVVILVRLHAVHAPAGEQPVLAPHAEADVADSLMAGSLLLALLPLADEAELPVLPRGLVAEPLHVHLEVRRPRGAPAWHARRGHARGQGAVQALADGGPQGLPLLGAVLVALRLVRPGLEVVVVHGARDCRRRRRRFRPPASSLRRRSVGAGRGHRGGCRLHEGEVAASRMPLRRCERPRLQPSGRCLLGSLCRQGLGAHDASPWWRPLIWWWLEGRRHRNRMLLRGGGAGGTARLAGVLAQREPIVLHGLLRRQPVLRQGLHQRAQEGLGTEPGLLHVEVTVEVDLAAHVPAQHLGDILASEGQACCKHEVHSDTYPKDVHLAIVGLLGPQNLRCNVAGRATSA